MLRKKSQNPSTEVLTVNAVLNPQNNFERNFDKRFDKNVSFCFCRVLPSINVCILLSNTPAQFSSDAKQLLHFVSRPAAAALCPLA